MDASTQLQEIRRAQRERFEASRAAAPAVAALEEEAETSGGVDGPEAAIRFMQQLITPDAGGTAQRAAAAPPTAAAAPVAAVTRAPPAPAAAAPAPAPYVPVAPAAAAPPEDRQCRICLSGDEDQDSGRLFAPCRCTGSVKLVHVKCLEAWRSQSSQRQSYFRCDSCLYEYRIERAKIAEFLLLFMDDRVAQVLVAVLFFCAAFAAGLVCVWYSPGLFTALLTQLKPPPEVWRALAPGSGNPACWDAEFSVAVCCPGGPRGNPSCWAHGFSFEHCCPAPLGAGPLAEVLRARLLPSFQALFCGLSALSVFGFARYVWRTLAESLQGGADGMFHLGMSAAWFSCLSSDEFGRIAIVVGVGVAMRELYNSYEKVVVQAKFAAQRLGERVLEVSN